MKLFGLLVSLLSSTPCVSFTTPFGHSQRIRTPSSTSLSLAADKAKKSGIDDALEQLRSRFDSNKFDFSSFKNPLKQNDKIDDDDDNSTPSTGTASTSKSSNANDNVKATVDETISSLTKRVQEFDATSITNTLLVFKDNIMSGEFGSRGELYLVAQMVLLVCVLIGGIPFIGEPLETILGPLLTISGLAITAIAVGDLGTGLSPWPTPVDDGSVQKDGLYKYVRHPMYCGLIMFCFGIGILSDSSSRILLTAALLYALDVKSTFEEEQLVAKYGTEYKQYQNDVTGKFFPNELLGELTSKFSSTKDE